MSNNEQYIGKTLYNANGYEIGRVTGIEDYEGQECFAIDTNTSSGRLWQTERLDEDRSDRIEVR